MYKYMAVKHRKSSYKKKVTPFLLPKDNDVLDSYVCNHKFELMNHVVDCIEYALYKNLESVDIFMFTSTNYIVTINKDDYFDNIHNIYTYYINNEYYEYCNRLSVIMKKTKK